VEFFRENEDKRISEEDFDKLHAKWCDAII